jgi:hypothetical protein
MLVFSSILLFDGEDNGGVGGPGVFRFRFGEAAKARSSAIDLEVERVMIGTACVLP